ncbi:MAG: deoxyribodipyrimidine photo-lyase [Gammaproteobacteria bacterium]|nr:deoxyribodipyrimidine photo-lyase [Gammaproteobacteria bacterium]
MQKILVWFRRDLRLNDNPALHAAKQAQLIPVYIHAPDQDAPWQAGGASNWWLHHSLHALASQLKAAGSRLIIRRGDAREVLHQLIEETGAEAVFVSRLYDPASIARDTNIKTTLTQQGITYRSFAGALLFEPWQILTKTNSPYKVFTPFWQTCQKSGLPSDVTPGIRSLPAVSTRISSQRLEDLHLLPTLPWDTQFYDHWQPGEAGAQSRLRRFIKEHLSEYEDARDFPAQGATSALSPHLHFGEISPRQVVYAIEHALNTSTAPGVRKQAQGFLRELVWREFTHHILYHFPHTTHKPLNPRFENFPWQTRRNKVLRQWQQGQTGFPIIDAGMRELWATGSMHNRVRMIVASLLTKNLGMHWLLGAKWFWDTLVDADLAQNSFNWQWVAGCGADAAPYFRIFNPVTQSEKFDADGIYIRRWVPELSRLPNKYLHAPWLAPAEELHSAGVVIGKNYPAPMCDLKHTREEALLAYKQHTRAAD